MGLGSLVYRGGRFNQKKKKKNNLFRFHLHTVKPHWNFSRNQNRSVSCYRYWVNVSKGTLLKKCKEKRGRNSFTPTILLAPTFRVTRLCNSHQLLLTQCLLSALRITPPASPIWSFYSLFSYANYCYSHIRSPKTHIPLFLSRRSNADAMWVIYSITF